MLSWYEILLGMCQAGASGEVGQLLGPLPSRLEARWGQRKVLGLWAIQADGEISQLRRESRRGRQKFCSMFGWNTRENATTATPERPVEGLCPGSRDHLNRKCHVLGEGQEMIPIKDGCRT